MNRPDCQDLRPVVIHRRATRYAVKMFFKDLWFAWRTLKGLPTGDDYAVAKLGMAPHHEARLGDEYERELTNDAIRKAAANL